MSAVIWVHMDALSREHPVFGAAPKAARPVYVWDAQDVASRGWSLKRCVFVLECLEEMEVEIVEGDYQTVLFALGGELFTARTPDPALKAVTAQLGATVVDAPAFAEVPDGADLRRFFRYWNATKGSVLKPTGSRT
ncbi:MAG: hypothetical protein WBF53_10245 [Litorimonas sp.]